MQLRRMVLFIPTMACGGAQRVATQLAEHWARSGVEVAIITLAPRGEDFYPLHPGIRRVSLDQATISRSVFSGLLNNIRRIIALRRILRAEKPQVAIALTNTANILLAFAALRSSGLLAIGSEHIHPPSEPMSHAWALLRKLSYGWLDAVVALSTETRDWLMKNTFAAHLPVIPNPVVLPLPRHHPVKRPADLVPAGSKVLLAMGRLVPQKGFDTLIAAFGNLARHHGIWHLAVLGEGQARPTLEAQVKALGLGDRIILPGHVGNAGDWFGRASLYVLSSRFEGFPVTLAEALAHGLPAVSFDCETGPRDIIRHETDGLLVPAGDANALLGALDRLMRDDDLRARFSASAVDITERYSLDRIAARWAQLFMKLRPSMTLP